MHHARAATEPSPLTAIDDTFSIAANVVLTVIPIVGWILIPFVGLGFLVIWVIVLIKALNGQRFKPVSEFKRRTGQSVRLFRLGKEFRFT